MRIASLPVLFAVAAPLLGWGGGRCLAAEAAVHTKVSFEKDVLPVLNVMETYETILRDLRNLDEHTAAEDISGIQNRIQKSGLIANMKAFQPNLNLVSFGQ